MKTQETSSLDKNQKIAVLRLWNNEYPSQLAYPDVNAFNRYLDGLTRPMHYLLVTDDGLIGGWAFTFERDTSRWFAIIVDSTYQRKGFGSTLLTVLKENNALLNGWVTDHNNYIKTDGSKYISPLNFYLKNGFKLLPGERFETNQLSAAKICYESPN